MIASVFSFLDQHSVISEDGRFS